MKSSKTLGGKFPPVPSTTEEKRDEAAEQLLMLSDFDRVTKLFRAALQALGSENTGAIAQLNTMIERTNVLDKEQREEILPLLGDLKALLKSSQDELKAFDKNAKSGLEERLKEVVAAVNLAPLHERIAKANAVIENSASTLETKAKAIEDIAAKTKTIGFFSSFKFMLTGVAIATALTYTFFSYSFDKKEEALKAKYDEQLQTKLEKFQPFSRLNQEHYGISVVQRNNLDHIQLFFRDTSGTIQTGKSFATDEQGKKFQVTFIEVPIYK